MIDSIIRNLVPMIIIGYIIFLVLRKIFTFILDCRLQHKNTVRKNKETRQRFYKEIKDKFKGEK